MRKSLLSAVCAVSLAAALTLPSGSQARGITVAVGSSFTTLDPYQATDLLSRTVAKSFYEGLYSFDKNLKPVPQLAESYEVSEDGLVYTFKLRDGVKFHDGLYGGSGEAQFRASAQSGQSPFTPIVL